MKKQNFKKLGIAVFALFMAISTLMPLKSNAQSAEDVVKVVIAIIDAVCPDNPQNRCKGGTCQDGACISFRSACEGSGSC